MAVYEIKPGDHLVYNCGAYYHHGIYCGDFQYNNRFYKDVVIHYQGKTKSGQIRGISYEKFASEKDIYIVPYKEGSCYSDEIVVNRAISKLGEPDYNLFGNNCEHFAHWCKTGKKISDQVNQAITIAGGFGGGVLGGVAVVLLPVALPGGAVAAVVSGLTAGAGGYKLGEFAANLFTKSTDYDIQH
jgi:hypothetical protein